MKEPNQNFQIGLSRAGDNMHLIVRDVTSTKVVMEADFSASDFLDLMSARETGAGVPVWFLPDPARRAIGRYPGVVSRTLSREESTQDEEALAAWVDGMHRFVVGSEIADAPRKRGGGTGATQVSFRSYFDTKEEADAWAVLAQQRLDKVAPPAKMIHTEMWPEQAAMGDSK
jgi:hypothetical protein